MNTRQKFNNCCAWLRFVNLRSCQSKKSGFTLIELLLVLLILGIASSIVVPAIGKRLGNSTPKKTAFELRTTMSELRLLAITEGQEQTLIIDTKDNNYWRESGRMRNDNYPRPDLQLVPIGGGRLSASTVYQQDKGELEFRFYPDGTNSGGQVFISEDTDSRTVVYAIHLNPLLGTTTVERLD